MCLGFTTWCLGYYERLRDKQIEENNKKLAALGIQGLICSVHSTQKNASTDKNVRAEGSDSSYLPGGEDGNDEEDDIESNSLEKVASQILVGCLNIMVDQYIFREIY